MSGILITNGTARRTDSPLPTVTPLSIGGWVQLTSYHGSGFAETMAGILTTSFQAVALTVSNAGALFLQGNGGASPLSFSMALNTWYYVGLSVLNLDQRAYVWDEAGTLLGSTSRTDDISAYNPSGYLITVQNASGNIGGWNTRVWQAALTSGEFVTERNSPTVVRTADLWGNYPYVSGSLRSDTVSGRDLNATSGDSDWPGAEPTFPPSGAVANAAFFGANS